MPPGALPVVRRDSPVVGDETLASARQQPRRPIQPAGVDHLILALSDERPVEFFGPGGPNLPGHPGVAAAGHRAGAAGVRVTSEAYARRVDPYRLEPHADWYQEGVRGVRAAVITPTVVNLIRALLID